PGTQRKSPTRSTKSLPKRECKVNRSSPRQTIMAPGSPANRWTRARDRVILQQNESGNPCCWINNAQNDLCQGTTLVVPKNFLFIWALAPAAAAIAVRGSKEL